MILCIKDIIIKLIYESKLEKKSLTSLKVICITEEYATNNLKSVWRSINNELTAVNIKMINIRMFEYITK